jgi:hypothetical protein
MFRSTTIIRELTHLILVKVTLMLKQSVKLRRYVLCGGVATCCHTDCFNISVTLARTKRKLPDDGRGPKHVAAISI